MRRDQASTSSFTTISNVARSAVARDKIIKSDTYVGGSTLQSI